MKRLFLIVMLAVMGASVNAQPRISEKQSQEVMNQLSQAAASMQSMQCRFVQEKTSPMLAEPSVSEGVMYFVAPDKMRWEYVKPYAFALVVNGDRIVNVTDGKAEALEGNANRMYQGIVNIIMGSASGLIKNDPRNGRLYVDLAECYVAMNRKQDAVKVLSDYMKMDNRNSAVRNALDKLQRNQ